MPSRLSKGKVGIVLPTDDAALLARWWDAIFHRVSVRSFDPQPIPESFLHRLTKTIDLLQKAAPSARAVILGDEPRDILRGAAYGLFVGAQGYIALLGSPKEERIDQQIGYLGEGLVLEATALGLGTCWVGGMFRASKMAKKLASPGERVYAIIPLGYPASRQGYGHRVLKGLARSKGRKDLATICPFFHQAPPWVKAGVETARLAPSAMNRQPWRFTLQDDRVILTAAGIDTPFVSKKLDCGIALFHFELGARHAGWEGHWEWLDAPRIAAFYP